MDFSHLSSHGSSFQHDFGGGGFHLNGSEFNAGGTHLTAGDGGSFGGVMNHDSTIAHPDGAIPDSTHLSTTDGLACTVKGSLQACNGNIMSPMAGGAAAGAVVGSATGPQGAAAGAVTGGLSGGIAGCVGGVVNHLSGCW